MLLHHYCYLAICRSSYSYKSNRDWYLSLFISPVMWEPINNKTGIRSRLYCCCTMQISKWYTSWWRTSWNRAAQPSLALILAIYIAVCQKTDTLFWYPWIKRQHDENKTQEVRGDDGSTEARHAPQLFTWSSTRAELHCCLHMEFVWESFKRKMMIF